jgi:sialidase-1
MTSHTDTLMPHPVSLHLALAAILSTLQMPSSILAEEGRLEPFLGPARIEMQQLFFGQRFPNVVVCQDGSVLATWGNDGVVARRSEDGGAHWSEPTLIMEGGFQGGGLTVDRVSGDVIAFIEEGHPPAPIHLFRSQDHGQSWQRQGTEMLPNSKGHLPSMHMNEHGITLQVGAYAGRLIRPSRWYAAGNRREEWPHHYTNALFSDDRGKSWQASEPFPEMGTGEACIIELSDGTLYYNSRVHWDQNEHNTRRRSALSRDGGKTWVDWRVVHALPDGHQHRSYGCMGGLTRLPVEGRDLLVFSNLDTPKAVRERITLWLSADGGQTWPIKRLVFDGPSGYSSMHAGQPGTASEGWIYLLFEGGPSGGGQMVRVNLSWLLQGVSNEDGVLPDWLKEATP